MGRSCTTQLLSAWQRWAGTEKEQERRHRTLARPWRIEVRGEFEHALDAVFVLLEVTAGQHECERVIVAATQLHAEVDPRPDTLKSHEGLEVLRRSATLFAGYATICGAGEDPS